LEVVPMSIALSLRGRRDLLQDNDKFTRNLDWNLLKVFHEIVRARGISRAADVVSRKQPALSLALRRLEVRMGTLLCKRGAGGFELTNEGAAVAEVCSQVMDVVRELPNLVAEASGQARGRLRLNLISNLVCPTLDEAIGAFHQKFPRVEFIVTVVPWAQVINALLRDEIDIGIGPSRTMRSELSYQLLFTEVHRPYCGPTHPLFGKIVEDPRDLRNEGFILTGADEPDELTEFRVRNSLGARVAGMTEHLEEARRLTILGVGLCFLPDGYASPDVAAGRLWPLLHAEGAPRMDVFIIENPNASRRVAGFGFREELLKRSWPTPVSRYGLE
jgi:DNA-binding transcriptional LysR family regulator